MIRKIKWFFQKHTRGYSDRDLWNLDGHLSVLIYKRIEAFRKNILEGNFVGVPMSRTNPDEGMELEEWLDTLDAMIWSFRYGANDNFPNGDHLWTSDDFEPLGEAECTDEQRKKALDIWQECSVKYKKGMEAFAEHFGDLWD